MNQNTNELELAAWLEWKKWCSIFRVYDPQPAKEELEEGKTDDLSRTERNKLFSALRNAIFSAVNGKIDGFYFEKTRFADEEEGSDNDGEPCGEENEEETQHRSSCVSDPLAPFISTFDEFMKGEKKEKEEDFILSGGITYKDFIFYNVQKSDDLPLKVIRGKITSKSRGYILEIIKKYYRENHAATDLSAPSRIDHSSLRDAVSLDESVNPNDPDSITYGELIETARSSDPKEVLIDVTELCSQFTRVEKLLILAEDCGLSLDTPELNTAAGLGKSALYDRQSKIFGPKGKVCNLIMPLSKTYDIHLLLNSIKKAIFSSLLPEKDTEAFLRIVTQKWRTEEKKRQQEQEEKWRKQEEKRNEEASHE